MKRFLTHLKQNMMRMVRRYLYLKPNEEINTMSRIVTQDKLNELTGKSIDYGQGGGLPDL